MILLFMAVIMVIFAFVKRQYKFALIGVEAGLFGSLQELLQKPELEAYADLLNIAGAACLLFLVVTVILLAVGGKKDGQ